MKMQKLIIEDCLQLVEFFKTLGDSTRLRIVLELKTKRCVGELAEELEMSQSAVSHQLNILKANGIVKSQRQGKYIYYIVQKKGSGKHVIWIALLVLFAAPVGAPLLVALAAVLYDFTPKPTGTVEFE